MARVRAKAAWPERPVSVGCSQALLRAPGEFAVRAEATAGGFTNTSQMVTAGHVAFNFSSLTWRSYRNNTGFKSDVQLLPKGPARQTAATWADCLTMPSVAKSPDAR